MDYQVVLHASKDPTIIYFFQIKELSIKLGQSGQFCMQNEKKVAKDTGKEN